jgi:S-adenosyl methyltransferase
VADSSSSAGASGQPPEVNTSVPQTARIWNYWLGGKDNFRRARRELLDDE